MARWNNVELSFSNELFKQRLEHIAVFAATTGMEGAVATYLRGDDSVICSTAFTPSENYRKRKGFDMREIDMKPLLIARNAWRTNTLMSIHSHPSDAQTNGGFPEPSPDDMKSDEIIWEAVGDIPSGIVQRVDGRTRLTLYAPGSNGLEWQLVDVAAIK